MGGFHTTQPQQTEERRKKGMLLADVPLDALCQVLALLGPADRRSVRGLCRCFQEAPAVPGACLRVRETMAVFSTRTHTDIGAGLPTWASTGLRDGRLTRVDFVVGGGPAMDASWEQLVARSIEKVASKLFRAGLGSAVELVTVSPATDGTNSGRLLGAFKLMAQLWPWRQVQKRIMSSTDPNDAIALFDGDSCAALSSSLVTQDLRCASLCMFCPACVRDNDDHPDGSGPAFAVFSGHRQLRAVAEVVSSAEKRRACAGCGAMFAEVHVVSALEDAAGAGRLQLLPFAGAHFMAASRRRTSHVNMLCVTAPNNLRHWWPPMQSDADDANFENSSCPCLSEQQIDSCLAALEVALARGVPLRWVPTQSEPFPQTRRHRFSATAHSRARCVVDPKGAWTAELRVVHIGPRAGSAIIADAQAYNMRLRLTTDPDGVGVVLSFELYPGIAGGGHGDSFLVWMTHENARRDLRAIGAGWVAAPQPNDGLVAAVFCVSVLWPFAQTAHGSVVGSLARLVTGGARRAAAGPEQPCNLDRAPVQRLGQAMAAVMYAERAFDAVWREPQFLPVNQVAARARFGFWQSVGSNNVV